MGLTATSGARAYCEELVRFHGWRQAAIGELLREIDAKYFSKELNGSFGSLFIILKHLVWAERVWLGRVRPDIVASVEETDVPGLLTAWSRNVRDWTEFVAAKPEADFDKPVSYFNTKGRQFENTLTEIVIHLVDHSTYHIGQMMNAVRAFGFDPVTTNYIHYLRAKAKEE